MRYPLFLPENGRIGFLAPSFGCATEPYKSAFENAKKKLGGLGHSFLLGPNVYADCGIGISNTPEKCGEEVNMMFDSEADVLISCGGGELMCEILPYVDFDRLKDHPAKWFMGYSDNTNLTFLLNTICDTASVYGPCASTFGQASYHKAVEDAYLLLCGKLKTVYGYKKWEKESFKSEENPLATYNVTEDRRLVLYIGKEKAASLESLDMEGRLIGGCIDCLKNLVGTRFDKVSRFNDKYSKDGIIWFLESCDLGPFDLRRAMWTLKEAGWFEKAKGFIIGRPLKYGADCFGLNMYRAVVDIIGDMGLPIIMDADIGHLPPQMPIISGAYGKINLTGQEFKMDYILK